jgi:RNA-directed DNA polymerase
MYAPRWVLEADISKFFDELSHVWLLENIPLPKPILKELLRAGFIRGGSYEDTIKGTPQGGPISPTIANMALNGLEACLGSDFKLVRYADDFVVIGKTKALLETEALARIVSFLDPRGLRLNMDKTLITCIEQGFDFLGFNFREYPVARRA